MSPQIYAIPINIKTDKQADAVKIEKPRFYIDPTLCVDLGNYKASLLIWAPHIPTVLDQPGHGLMLCSALLYFCCALG